MPVYRLADLNIAYEPQYDDTAALLTPFETAGEAHLTLHLSPSAMQEELSRLPAATNGVREAAALLRAVSAQLPAFDRLVLHAASVTMDGHAYTFVAPSGTGKTTHVRLWKQRFAGRAEILNGDRLLVHIRKDGVMAFGGPWRGKEGLGQNAFAPLKGLFLLTRSDMARCEPLSPSEMLPHLLRAVRYPKSEKERLQTLSLLEQLISLVPCYRLYAPLSMSAAEAAFTQTGGIL
ncbi:MAG: hypothetical protein IJD01_08165 [Clostridia bacterium]|nr:hypothetical protein [Clostridia bacterium]